MREHVSIPALLMGITKEINSVGRSGIDIKMILTLGIMRQ